MKSLHLNMTALTMALLVSGSLFAQTQQDIRLSTSVEPLLNLVSADDAEIPATPYAIPYTPGRGLSPFNLAIRVNTNDVTKGVIVRLAEDPRMENPLTRVVVPLKVSLDGVRLNSTDPIAFSASELQFAPSGTTASPEMSRSRPLALIFTQANTGNLASGRYEGVISVILTQAT